MPNNVILVFINSSIFKIYFLHLKKKMNKVSLCATVLVQNANFVPIIFYSTEFICSFLRGVVIAWLADQVTTNCRETCSIFFSPFSSEKHVKEKQK